jgi:hypothetical protein
MRSTPLVALLAIFTGCSQPVNLQPNVAAYGSYAVMQGKRLPPPAPVTDGCTEGCRCNGTGRERTGDGLSDSECRCPEGCKCKAKKATAVTTGTICKTGTCVGWPPKNIAR